MNSVMSPRLKIPKSRIPVRAKKPTTSIVNDSKRKVTEKQLFRAPPSTSTKLTESNNLKEQSNSEGVKPEKTAEKGKCVRTLKYDRNRQSSVTSKSKISGIYKKAESSQLKNNINIETIKKKVINQPSSVKERNLKSRETVSKSKIINDSSKRKIAALKTDGQTTKNKTIKPGVESSGPSSSDNLAPSRSVSEKENKACLKPRILAAQEDIKFEVNENSRKMILREQAPSPGFGNKMSGFRLSSRPSQRPSIYQPMKMVADPYKEAMRAIACFSAKRKQENGNPEKESKVLSPFMDRNSLYMSCADPKREVMESLEKLNLKQQSDKLTSSSCLSEKENKASLKPSILTAQKDIKFEVNENSRKMILREHAPSPGIGNKMSGLRLSWRHSQRPSIYQPMKMVADPYKEAMRAIACYSEKKKQEKYNLEKASRLLSPSEDRNSFYTQCADPRKEVMESLRKLTLKQEQQKSTKKVTFNLNVIEHTPKNDSDAEPEVIQEGKLSQIDEKSEENTPSSPEIKNAALPPAHEDKADTHLADFEKNNENHQNNKSVTVNGGCENFSKSILSNIRTLKHQEVSPGQCKQTVSQCYEKIDSSPLFTNLCFKNASAVDDEISTKYERTSNKKIHTPRPISFYSRSNLQDSCSPEFLVNGGSGAFLKEAPICTPLVLKSIAKNSELSPDVEHTLSPVRLKLNFEEKETPRVKISDIFPSFNRKQIRTVQSQLDELADQECRVFLSDESLAVVCGRYITNPVAQTLAEGDEMHFIPIKL